MNSTNIRRSAATLTMATAAVLVLGTVSASPASADRRAPDGGSTTAVGSNIGSMDIDEVVAMLKVQRAQYQIDNPQLLR